MLEALAKSLGVVTTACNAVGINRASHYEWLENDPEYKAAVEDVQEVLKDFGETQYIKLMQQLDPATVRQFAKTKLKDRGYGEDVEHTITVKDFPDWLK